MSKIADILDKAADLIEPEGAWTQEAEARDVDGFELDGSLAEEAVCWCAGGAIWKASDLLRCPEYAPTAQAEFSRFLGGRFVPEWNDSPGQTQAEAVSALREAAAKARAVHA